MIFKVAALFFAVLAAASAQQLTVETEDGTVEGHYKDGAIEFQGIPFATPPLGELRWAEPQKPTPWQGVYTANYEAPGCSQHCNLPPGNCPLSTSEDCLYLSVFTPTAADPAYPDGYPVYVWIHGGAFEQGLGDCALYNGTKLAQYGMVVVAMNYRLGALGFMKSESMEGNYGFLDQVLALKWVQKNIAGFGGNPADVTIGGQSAGGMSVAAHMTSPISQGLFHKVIMESNPLGLPFHTATTAAQNANSMAEYVGCPTDDVQCMRTKSAEEILDAQDSAIELNLDNLFINFLPFTPVVGNDILPDQPLYMMMRGESADVPLLAGSVLNDAWLFVYELFTKPLGEKAYGAIIQAVFGLRNKKSIMAMYPPDLLDDTSDTRPVLDVLGTDLLFYCPLRNVSRSLISEHSSPVYIYRFDHVISFDCWGPGYEFCVGVVCHGSELPFEFEVWTDGIDISYDPTDAEVQLAHNEMSYWANFIRNGNPNTGVPVPVTFPQYASLTDGLLVLEEPVSTANRQRTQYCNYWDKMGFYY